jgi:DNA-binding response OmpR family regulator
MLSYKLNILLVDHDLDECLLFDDAIRKISSNITLSWCNELHLAYAHMDKISPHLIFLDINMPVKNGIIWLGELKANEKYRHIPVIMYSVSILDKDKEDSRLAGAHHYMVKPYVEWNLISCLKKVFDTDWRVAPALPPKERFLIEIDYKA